jgi:hypothetical protein
MRSLRCMAVAVLALLLANPVAAQSALAELGRATDMMHSADQAFRDQANERPDKRPSDQALDQAFRQITEATSIFLRSAPQARIDDALEGAQKAYEGAHLSKPSTLLAAAEECDKRHDPTLARYLTAILWLKFSLTRVNAEAEVNLGPLPDNPAFYASLRPPVTGIDLLTNLKWAFDQNAWLREDLYTPKTLRTFLGVDLKPQRFVDGGVSNFAVVRSPGAGQCTFQADRRIKPAGKASGFLDIRCTYGRADMPTFEEVEQVFGSRGRDRGMIRLRSPHAPPLPPATAPHGNQTIVYDFGSTGMKRSLGITFAPDARFAELSASAEDQ